MLAALISSISGAVNLVVDKLALSRERLSLRVFIPILFVFLFGLTVILWPLLGKVDWQAAIFPNNLFLVFLMVVIAIAHNVLFYQSIQREKVHQHEIIMMLLPLVTIVLAALFYPEQYDQRVFILALVASLALLGAKSTKEHFFTDRTSYHTFLAVILMAAESIIIRELLFTYTPVALYAVRTFFLALFFIFYYRPEYGRVSGTHWRVIFWSALIGVIGMLTQFYAYAEQGIVYTTLIMMLSPVIVFLASWELLHERIRARVIVASIIILICVTWATVLIA